MSVFVLRSENFVFELYRDDDNARWAWTWSNNGNVNDNEW